MDRSRFPLSPCPAADTAKSTCAALQSDQGELGNGTPQSCFPNAGREGVGGSITGQVSGIQDTASALGVDLPRLRTLCQRSPAIRWRLTAKIAFSGS